MVLYRHCICCKRCTCFFYKEVGCFTAKAAEDLININIISKEGRCLRTNDIDAKKIRF